MLNQIGLFLAAATLLAACATAPAGTQRATSPTHATGEGLSKPSGGTGAAPMVAPNTSSEHRHH